MKKTKITLFFCLAFASVIHAGNLTVAHKGGRSDYQIVIPDQTPGKNMASYIELAGKVIQKAIGSATGVGLEVVEESKRDASKPAIYVGATKAAQKAGLSAAGFAPWEHEIAVRGKDIFVYGKDLPSPLKNSSGYASTILGTLKAACAFVEKFARTRFIGIQYGFAGIHDGMRTLPLEKVTVPEKFTFRSKPRFLHNDWDKGGLLYTVANNFCFDGGAEYRVHYHNNAIPQEKYFKSHPEYFALINGKRYRGRPSAERGITQAQYCLSNPEVQELIYQEALARADRGFRVVEFGQSDGFLPCECDKCRKMYNTDDWGEKLWCLHRDLAERLQKERPEVTPAIACYGPTRRAPKSFNRFPCRGMMIDVAPIAPEQVEEWKKFNIAGMATWTYCFGAYLYSGVSPSFDFARLRGEARKLRATPVRSIYNCGLRSGMALNGPWVYAWGHLLENPDIDSAALLAEYCEFGFGAKAAPHFVKFFDLIDRRMVQYPEYSSDDFNHFVKKSSAVKLWNDRYPPEVLAQLEKHFNAGAKLVPPGNDILEHLKTGFEYLRLSAKVCHALQKVVSDADKERLADAVESRNRFIDSLPVEKNGQIVKGSFYVTPKLLRFGGWMGGKFGGAFAADPAVLRQKKHNADAVAVKDFSDPAWNRAKMWNVRPMNSANKPINATFQIGFNEKAVLLKFRAPAVKFDSVPTTRDDRKLWLNAVWEILIADGGSYIRHFAFNQAPGSAYDETIARNKKRNVGWNPEWSHRDKVENGVWETEATIPFTALDGKPEPEGKLHFQIAYSAPNAAELYAWNIPLSGTNFADPTGMGAVRFGQSGAAEKTIELNGDFSRRDGKNHPKLWYSSNGELKCETRDGKSALWLKPSGTSDWTTLSSDRFIPLEDDETAELTITLRGNGTGEVNIGWFNPIGAWAVNQRLGLLNLKAEPQRVVYQFKRGHLWEKGAERFRLGVSIKKPGTELIVDEVSLKIRRDR